LRWEGTSRNWIQYLADKGFELLAPKLGESETGWFGSLAALGGLGDIVSMKNAQLGN